MKKNLSSKVAIFILFIMLSATTTAFASTQTYNGVYIDKIEVTRGNGFKFYLDGVSLPCGSGNSAYINVDDSANNYRELLSMLLTAYTSKSKIGITTGTYVGGDNVCDVASVWTYE